MRRAASVAKGLEQLRAAGDVGEKYREGAGADSSGRIIGDLAGAAPELPTPAQTVPARARSHAGSRRAAPAVRPMPTRSDCDAAALPRGLDCGRDRWLITRRRRRAVLAILLAPALLLSLPRHCRRQPGFRVETLAPGVHAAIRTRPAGAHGRRQLRLHRQRRRRGRR